MHSPLLEIIGDFCFYMAKWIIQIGTVIGLRNLSFESSNLSFATNISMGKLVDPSDLKSGASASQFKSE